MAILCLARVPLLCPSGPSTHPRAVLTAQAPFGTTTLLCVTEKHRASVGRGHQVRTPEVRTTKAQGTDRQQLSGCRRVPSGVLSISAALPAPLWLTVGYASDTDLRPRPELPVLGIFQVI